MKKLMILAAAVAAMAACTKSEVVYDDNDMGRIKALSIKVQIILMMNFRYGPGILHLQPAQIILQANKPVAQNIWIM